MKKIFTLLATGSILLVANKCFAQQNLFNVPNSEITKKHNVFFQYQVNLNNVLQNNLTVDLGLGKGFEVGLNVLDFAVQTSPNIKLLKNENDIDLPYAPLCMLNIQKIFHVSENFAIGLGTQTGINAATLTSDIRLATFNYCNFNYGHVKKTKLSLDAGVYYGNRTYEGYGNKLGVMCGAEYEITKKIHALGDAIIGNNANSVSVLGITFFPSKHWMLSSGYQLPMPGSNNKQAIVFEITKI